MKYTLDEVTEKLERACRRIDELQEKNLRLAEKNNSLIKDSIKAQEILTSQSVVDDERDDLERRLQNAELFIERMKDEKQRANEKYGERIKKLEAEKAVMLEALEEVVALTENLPVCPFCGCVLDHRPDCLSHEIVAAIRKARQESEG